MRLMILVTFAIACAGGCRRPERIVVVTPPPCLKEAPPTLPALPAADLAGPDEGCPAAFEVCMTLRAAQAVDAYLAAADSYMRRARARCGPRKDPTP